MKTSTLPLIPLIAISLIAFQANSLAGEIAGAVDKNPLPPAPEAPPEPKPWKFTLDSRARWEFGDEDGREESNAYTLRNRAGILLGPFEGLSLFTEYEGTVTADRDSYQAASVHGLGQNKTVIADPESHELNQLWMSYKNWDTEFKVGRQRLILDNARFIANVGWRQNEQTFDAVTIKNISIENLTLFYGYINRVERIFGSGDIQAPAQEDFEGDSHLGNISYKFAPELTLTGYAYLLDLNNPAGDAASNNSYGLQAKGAFSVGEGASIPYLLEGAYQTDGDDSSLSYGAWYYRADAGINVRKMTVGAGFEHLGSGNGTGFQTPLALLHAFNGWADKFLATPAGGLNDAYVYFNAGLTDDLAFQSQYHWFGPDSGSLDYGQEVGAALVYTINKNFSAGAKYAQYFADEFATDTSRFILDFGFKF
ncbi:MAG: alginate export family protein [Verrucomicrobia bacterium]|nr:alginate export family protein [Verrucomicrobiota bacterium]